MEFGSSHIYSHWIKEGSAFFEPLSEDATAVDCSNCHMVRPRGLTRDLGPFRADLKCCTFDPYLPSFVLGAPHFAARVSSEVLDDYFGRRRLTPLGALPRNSFSLKLPKTNSICESGKDPSRACAFLSKDENVKCTIHEFRPSPCAGYTCRSKFGAVGFKSREKWELKINSFEWTLSHLAAFELGYTLDDVEDEFKSANSAMEFYRRAFVTALKISL